MIANIEDLRNAVRTGFADIPFVTPFQFAAKRIQMPQTVDPYLYVVLDGVLRLYTPSGIMDYMPGQYSISRIDTPLSGTVLDFSDCRDFLAVSIEFMPSDVIQAVLGLDDSLTVRIMSEGLTEREMSASDRAVVQAVCRLFSVMEQGVPSEFIRKNAVQEMIYHALCGSSGRQFIQSIVNIQRADEIYQANSWIKENFREFFSVEELAEQQNMSVSLFHQRFKSAVGMGPLQCQKRLRLTEARRLMLDEGRNVTEASIEVGYESLSQFIRDYRKMFGAAPKGDVMRLRRRLKE